MSETEVIETIMRESGEFPEAAIEAEAELVAARVKAFMEISRNMKDNPITKMVRMQ